MQSHSDHGHRHQNQNRQNRHRQSQVAQRQQAMAQKDQHTEFATMSREGAANMKPMGLQDVMKARSESFNKAAAQRKANNTGLPDNLKSGIENLSGYSMDDVNVHYNSPKPAQLQAHAYAQGSDIHLGAGQEKHLPHEAWHVVQQKQGRVKPNMQMKGQVNVNDDARLEKEADVLGGKANNHIETKKSEPSNQSSLNTVQLTQSNVVQKADDIQGALDALKAQNLIPVKNPTRKIKNVLTKIKFTGSYNDLVSEYDKQKPNKPAETSDVSDAYQVNRACAIQALIGFGIKPSGKTTAKELHHFIWEEKSPLSGFKEYDLDDVYPELYKNLGLKMTKPANSKTQIKDLDPGKCICRISGHMLAVSIDKRNNINFYEDPNNKLAKESDIVEEIWS